jgi:hypothetical protein
MFRHKTEDRLLVLKELWQRKTYGDMLVGFPTRGRNRRAIEYSMKYARDHYKVVHLVVPEEELIPLNKVRKSAREWARIDAEMRPALIPGTACVGYFESCPPARNENEVYSYLAVVWFQEEYAMPINPVVVKQIKRIDWKNLAHDATP